MFYYFSGFHIMITINKRVEPGARKFKKSELNKKYREKQKDPEVGE